MYKLVLQYVSKHIVMSAFRNYTKTYDVQKTIHCCCLYALSLAIVL